MIEGVSLHSLKQISVPKGDLWHAFKMNDEGFVGFGEAYLTQIEPHQIKGWKRHNRYVLNIVVIVGAVKFVIYDDRQESITRGQFEEIILSPIYNYQRLTAGAAESENSILMDLIPELHQPEESDRKELEEIKYNFNV